MLLLTWLNILIYWLTWTELILIFSQLKFSLRLHLFVWVLKSPDMFLLLLRLLVTCLVPLCLFHFVQKFCKGSLSFLQNAWLNGGYLVELLVTVVNVGHFGWLCSLGTNCYCRLHGNGVGHCWYCFLCYFQFSDWKWLLLQFHSLIGFSSNMGFF